MHHQPHNHERALSLSILRASGPGKVHVLSQIEPQTPRLVVPLRQCLQVSALRPYSPQNPKTFGFPGVPTGRTPPIQSRHRLRPGIRWCLIAFYPLAFDLDRRGSPWRALSRRGVSAGSSYFTCPQRVPTPTSHPHLSLRVRGQHNASSWCRPMLNCMAGR